MSMYKKVLVAIDPFIDCNQIVTKAKGIAAEAGEIHFIHVMDVVMIFPSASLAPPRADLPGVHGETQKAAHKLMSEIAEQHGIPNENIHIKIGSTAKKIREFAVETEADAIVIGSHGRHGLGLLLGSTASSVIHGASCDVLVVRITAD